MVKLDYKWNILNPNNKEIIEIAQKNNISIFLAKLLFNRGLKTQADIEDFLDTNPKIKFPDYQNIELCELIKHAIDTKELITIYGDYDVDGISSTAILFQFLKALGANVNYFLPSRYKEGYGLNKNTLNILAQKGTKLLITVDCGISNYEEINYAKQLGLKVIITDHHIANKVPLADFVINPKLYVELSSLYNLAGVGVTFFLIKMLAEYFNVPKKNIVEYLDLVTLGTIADIVPLQGINRSIVKRGLLYLKNTKRLGLKTLCEGANLKLENINVDNIAYQIAPRLNASGRMLNPMNSLELFLTQDINNAYNLAQNLNKYNQDRQNLCDKLLKQTEELIKTEIDLTKEKVILLYKEGWNHGVIGIVASRLVEKYYRPVFLICLDKDIGKGSARSKHKFNIAEALHAHSSYFETYGGHEGAGGLKIKKENIPLFKQSLLNYADTKLTNEDLMPSLDIDVVLSLKDINLNLLDEINLLSPFGHNNPKPIFASMDVEVLEQTLTKDNKHLMFNVKQEDKIFRAVFWNKGPLYPLSNKIDIAYNIESDNYNTIKLTVLDIKSKN